MVELGAAYCQYGQLMFMRWSDPGAQVYRWARPERWNPPAALPPPTLPAAPAKVPCPLQPPAPSAAWRRGVYRGFALGTGFNPVVAYLAGRGQGHGANPELTLRGLWRCDARAQAGRDRAIDWAAVAHRESYQDRGLGGTLVNSIFDTVAIPAFGGGYTVGSWLGAPMWVFLRLGHAVGLMSRRPTWTGTRSACGNVLGAAVGLALGLVAMLGPWGGVVVPRLVASMVEVLCGTVGALLFAVLGLRHFLPAACWRASKRGGPTAPPWPQPVPTG